MDNLEFIFVIIEMFAIVLEVGLTINQIVSFNKFEKEIKQKLYNIEIENKILERLIGIKSMNNIENIKFFLGDLKASNYNLSFIESVENLIQENKELKERNLRQQEQLNIANKKIQAQRGQLKVVNTSYTPNSKIKFRIIELEELLKSAIINDSYKKEVEGRIRELKALLEEGEINGRSNDK